jgi:alpha-L-fucosidase
MNALLPLPSPRQLAWQAMETNAFVHFGPNTFTDVEWGGGEEDPNLFAPTDLDCDQWVRAFKAAGLKGVILTAKHHDGFCLWPSKLSRHTVAQTKWRDGKGDVVGELAAACRRGGLKFGIYLSPWDRNHPAYGTPEYNQIFTGMLKEVLTHYGPVFEVWFDGANGEGPNGKKQVYDWDLFIGTVRKYQPKAVIFSDAGPDVRWCGNEEGVGGEMCWSTIPSGRYLPGTPFYAELTAGRRNGDLWIPAEVNTSIRPGWFYHADQDSKVRTPENLMRLYETSVGRNGVMLLNVPPDRRGQLAAPDVAALTAFGVLRKQVYGHDLAKGGRQTGDSYSLRGSVVFDRVELREPVSQGQRVAAFRVEARVSGEWREIAKGTTVGNCRILPVPVTTADGVRVLVDDSLATPTLLPVRLYFAGDLSLSESATEKIAGQQAADGSLTLRLSGGDQSLLFEGIRGEIRVEVEGSGEGEVLVEVGGQTLRGRLTSGVLELGKAAIVVGGPTRLVVRVDGNGTVRVVRFMPVAH